MKKIAAVALIASATSLTGCATILSGSTEIINVSTTSGEKVEVTVRGQKTAQTFTTPTVITIQKGGDLVFTPDSENCAPHIASKSIESTFFVNILTGGLFGSSTDFSSGSVWSYDNNILINCRKS